MTENRPAWLVLLVVVLSALVGTVLGVGIGSVVASAFYRGEGSFLIASANGTYTAEMAMPILIMQGITSLFGFLLVPYLAYRVMTQKGLKSFSLQKLNGHLIFLAFFITIAFAVVDSVVIEWNKSIVFPEFLKSFETWARDYEQRLEELTKMFTKFNNVGEFILALLVVAVGAGLCEEFLFRGIIQKELYRGTNNIHLSIWAAAFLFSAMHMQFFGFFPRMLLGALFGYLYYWSGNLLVPMFAHFVNNGFSLLMIYLYQLKVVDTDIESEQSAPWYVVMAFTIITIGLLYLFKKKSEDPNPSFA